MTDANERPRPAYGEYATPEEQRARITQPDLTWNLEQGQDPDAAAAATSTSPVVAPRSTAAASTMVPAKGRRLADRIATIALLTYGLINVIGSAPAMLDYEQYLGTVLSLMNVTGQLSDPAAARPWGIAAAFVLIIGWLLTAVLSWRSLSRGRLTWWIPLVGGIVFTVIAVILLVVPMASDPALMQAIVDSTR